MTLRTSFLSLLVVICAALFPAPERAAFAQAHPPQPHAQGSAPSKPKHVQAPPKSATPPGYSQSVKAWHTPPGTPVPRDAQGRPLLALFAINTRERLDLPARDDDGGFSASDLDRAARFLRDPRTSAMHPIEPRLLSRIYRVERKFDAAELRVISGYRLPKPGGRSNHGRGRAIDLVVPGAADEEVAKFAREQGYGGVGVYPTSGFVHIDVRDRSYFWVDTSGPGGRRRERGILPDLASRADEAAKQRGDSPVRPYRVLLDVDAAGARSLSDADDANDHDDEDDSTL
ncbi:MAG: DUF882 domain-containing protein [Polyangiaceae bacterium]